MASKVYVLRFKDPSDGGVVGVFESEESAWTTALKIYCEVKDRYIDDFRDTLDVSEHEVTP